MILVTGGTGLLGTYILLQLAKKNKRIKALVREETLKSEVLYIFKIYEPSNYQQLYDTIQWIKGDLLDISSLEKALEGVVQVYHIAGKVSFNESDKRELYKANIEGTKNIVNLSINKKIQKFCFISSIATLDKAVDKELITEDSEWILKNIHSSYACSKYGAEMEVWRGSQEGLKVVVVNPGIILGSGNWERSSGMLYKMALSGKAYYTSGSTGYVDAQDVANLCVLLMDDNTIHNEKYILIAENASYEKVFIFLRQLFKKSKPMKISDFWLKKIAFLSRILPIKKKISKSAVNALIQQLEYSNQKIKKQLNYDFISLEQSLKFHANNYINHKNHRND